ncbi:MAG: hypothetical protein HZB16_21865, partial [Armatimonadetes bacterium]|nr:hypothetical protein [Armatimonadota bacterium]
MEPLRRIAVLVLIATSAGAQPVISWASDPVRPNETVLLRGAGFGAAPAVEFAHLPEGAARRLPAVQPADDALKFLVPADAVPGVYRVRVLADGQNSAPVLLNAPRVWWLQGDAGADSTPGGWLRVFGTCLAVRPELASVQLTPGNGAPVALSVTQADGWSLRCEVPANLAPGRYGVVVGNGQGGPAARATAGPLTVGASAPWPETVYSVLDTYGPQAVPDMRRSLLKYGQPVERTAGVLAALARAKAAGGGVVFFPAGRYHLNQPLELPPRTVLRGEGMGLVTLWWGAGRFNLDGGGDQGLAKEAEPEPPGSFINGPSFGIEDLSLYLPLNHRTGIDGYGQVRLRRVRVRVDHLWALDGNKRPEGTVARLGRGFEVTDCDILAKGQGLWPGEYGVIARNRITAGKVPCPLGGVRAVIVEDNTFTSTYPTAYQNIAGVGQDFYYARNRHEAAQTHQADFSFTFDAGGSAYHGALAAVDGARLTLAADPEFPTWAKPDSWYWKRAVVCVVKGRGAGQWGHVSSFAGRQWTLDTPLAVAPDTQSVVTIVPLCGRALIVGNQFADANWINYGFGTALDIVYAGNSLRRCAQFLGYGLASPTALLPNFGVQCFDNELSEGLGEINVNGSVRPAGAFDGAITQNIIHRRERFT